MSSDARLVKWKKKKRGEGMMNKRSVEWAKQFVTLGGVALSAHDAPLFDAYARGDMSLRDVRTSLMKRYEATERVLLDEAKRDPYVVEGSDVLQNRFGVTDEATLASIEAAYGVLTLLEARQVSFPLTKDGVYDVHRALFQDVYDWAGEPRLRNVYKAERVLGGMSVDYADVTVVDEALDRAVRRLIVDPWRETTRRARIETFARAFVDVWTVHPFREGNTRTLTFFAYRVAASHGVTIDARLLTRRPVHFREALVVASLGEYAERGPVEALFDEAWFEADSYLNES